MRDLVKRKNEVALKENVDQLRQCEEKLNQLKKMNQTLREEKMKQLLFTYQMLINRGESAGGTTNSKTADEKNQQLMSDTKKTNS
ncbi:ubiquitin carboxyl-terminal hydrolase 2-like [Dorcoceras hygrometricum]|uniref:Ubiquitin carboxyl-terminal hydrolase 2-like n=1 Tax=Dorcoceras hygrometricum TaxID=472368 RepID=A0A2Z7C3E5_9LAMI|nr:ubiquitin carboxyl-terminal hydrolase 2-like [Dorcoceras hygrometricum]